MIKFVNLKTGNVYDGSKPYIHWFDGQQSTGLIYSQPICFISDKTEVTVSMDAEVFSIIDPTSLSYMSINSVSYADLNEMKVKSLTLSGEHYDKYYLYIIYVIGSSSVGAEYIDEIDIDGEKFNIGADFYQEDETLYINSSNFGINIPESIQKAIYSVNVHEEKNDNITLNRKFKELLSNYWDVIANKGSYKSLINSLKWFEWGDIVRVRELWSHEENGKTIFDDREICSILEDKYKDSLNGFSKTTYISLYGALQKIIKNLYDDEKNPKLESIVSKWSKEDLMLKMCMLGNFYETYFMPIHLDLKHATMEDVVYTNTIKSINGGSSERNDYIYDTKDFDCIINNNQPIQLTNVSVGVDPYTLFGNKHSDNYDNHIIFGVKSIQDVVGLKNDDDLKKLYIQNYNGIGSIVNIKCIIPSSKNDFVKYEQLIVDGNICEDHKIYHERNNQLNIDFNILLTSKGPHNISLRFDTAGGSVFTKIFNVTVEDSVNVSLKVYKIKRKPYTNDNGFVESILKSNNPLNNMFMMIRESGDELKTYSQGLVAHEDGIGLNSFTVTPKNISRRFGNGYITKTKKVEKVEFYKIAISKKFVTELPDWSFETYRNDLVFIPEFHELIEFTPNNNINDFKIYEYDTLCIIPIISTKDGDMDLKWSEKIENPTWEFNNISTGETIKFSNYIYSPIIAGVKPLSKGYYDIVFRYGMSGIEHEIKLNSAFIQC